MKRIICALAAVCMAACLFSGCASPNDLQLDLSQGYGAQTRLLHLNASNEKNEARIRSFEAALEDPETLKKDVSLFAYYPDYLLVLRRGRTDTPVLVDINGKWVDFIYPEETEQHVYRSRLSAEEFGELVHQ